jgi:uroporphyrinogen-III synthase
MAVTPAQAADGAARTGEVPAAVGPLAGYTAVVSALAEFDATVLRAAFAARGARAQALPADGPRRVLAGVLSGAVDVVAFTDTEPATRFLRSAQTHGAEDRLRIAVRSRGLLACLRDDVAEPFRLAGLCVVVAAQPELTGLVDAVVTAMAQRRVAALAVAGHLLEVRGQAAVVDGRLIPLAGACMALLRALASRPGQVFSRDDLLELLPGARRDGHSVEVAVGRLRTALGDPKMVSTVLKRGYRLAI